MRETLTRWFAPPYSQLTALVAAVIAIAAEFTDPAALPILLGVFGPQWTKGLVAVCALVLLVSRALERQQKPRRAR